MTSMATMTLEEKRLKQLKQQLFGKEQSFQVTTSKNDRTPPGSVSQLPPTQTTVMNITSLRSDFIKITILSLLALSIQFLLFFANKNGLIKLFN